MTGRGTISAVLVALWFSVSGLPALQIESSVSMGSVAFAGDRAYEESGFSPGYPVVFSASVSGAATDTLGYRAGIVLDSSSCSILRAAATYGIAFLEITGGPTVGLFYTPETIVNPGLHASLRFELPGALFAYGIWEGDLGRALDTEGRAFREMWGAAIGWYVPNAIFTLSAEQIRFLQVSGSERIGDYRNDYRLSIDVFDKYAPYGILLSAGYRSVKKSWLDRTPVSDAAHTLGAAVMGFDVRVPLKGALTLCAGFEGSIYSYAFAGTEFIDLTDRFLFEASVGAVIDIMERE